MTPAREELDHAHRRGAEGAHGAPSSTSTTPWRRLAEVAWPDAGRDGPGGAPPSALVRRPHRCCARDRVGLAPPETFRRVELDAVAAACETAIHAWGWTLDHPQPADDGRGRHAQCLLPTRSNGCAAACTSTWRHRLRPPAQRPWHRRRGCRAGLAGWGGSRRGAAFGNGERTGNLDPSTSRSTLHAGRGPRPRLLGHRRGAALRRALQPAAVHPRHPTQATSSTSSFSGSHQDAIKKAFAARREGDVWAIPLPAH